MRRKQLGIVLGNRERLVERPHTWYSQVPLAKMAVCFCDGIIPLCGPLCVCSGTDDPPVG